MASTVKHLRSSTASKRPTASGLAEGQLAINTASGTPGLFLKNSAGAVVKVGPVHVGASAPNAVPAGSAGNSTGELWVNNSATIHGLNYYTGSAFVNLTPSGTATVAGLVELATNAETQTGTDTVRAVTPSGLQSKVSDSTSTTSSATIASSTAVKAAYDLADAALPKAGGRVTGNLEIGPAGSLSFEGSSDDSFGTTLAVVNPTADRTITLPNTTGTVITTGDSGTVTSAMIADLNIVNADINASASIALSKLATGALPSGITVASANIVDGTIVNADINASAAIVDTKLATISTAGKVSNSATTATNANTASAIVARDASGDFAAGDITISDKIIHAGDTDTAIRFPAANTVAVETGGAERLRIKSDGESYFQANNTTSAVTINQIGTGNALVVEDSSNPDATPFVIDETGRTVQGHTVALSLNGTGGTPICQLNGISNLFANACYSAVNWGDTSAPPGIYLAKARADAVETYTIVPNNQKLGELRFAGADGSQFQNAAAIVVESDGTPSLGIVPGRIVFDTANSSGTLTEAMRVNSGQELLIGYTADNGAYKLQVNSQIFATSATVATSDGRYKENVATLNGCIDLVNALRPVSFDWKPQQDITRIDEDGNSVLVREGHNFPDGKQVGFIAQEVQEVLADKPWLGSVIKQNVRPAIEDADGNELAPEEEFFGIAEGNLTAVLTAALQEAIAMIGALEARIAALEA
jgi:hypothetical protein